ncbi:hypothetical protein HK405_002470 [Cladochytrium tenue]|nr:hypothetical protein HK405_002470 [Cladochytrium tenue]
MARLTRAAANSVFVVPTSQRTTRAAAAAAAAALAAVTSPPSASARRLVASTVAAAASSGITTSTSGSAGGVSKRASRRSVTPKKAPPLKPPRLPHPPPAAKLTGPDAIPAATTHSRAVWAAAREHLISRDPRFVRLLERVGESRAHFDDEAEDPETESGEGGGSVSVSAPSAVAGLAGAGGAASVATTTAGGGSAPFGDRAFQKLVTSLVHQQLAGAAARTIHARLLAVLAAVDAVDAVGTAVPSPERVLAADDRALRAAGLSARKIDSLRSLAAAFLPPPPPQLPSPLEPTDADLPTPLPLSDERLGRMTDTEVIEELCRVKGIGEWTAHMFLMFGLKRVDVLPTGDLGVRKGMAIHFANTPYSKLESKKLPTPEQMHEWGKAWAPYRSYGAWYSWRLVEWARDQDKNEKKKTRNKQPKRQ